jgi:ATP-binding cassette subfamily F protein 3
VVYEIEYGTAVRYSGNYSSFVKQKRSNWEKQMKDHTMQKKEIERLNQLIEKFKHHPTKVSMARSKQKQIEHMTIINSPDRYDLRAFHINSTPRFQSGQEVLIADHLAIGYDHILSELSFVITRGQKLAVIGMNGIGKSTLLKTLIGAIPALHGSYRYGSQVDVGYFDQQIAQYSSDKSVLDEFWDSFPDLTETEVRTILGSFLFIQDDVFKQVSVLSGGERARLTLAKILKRRPNFLILDEPTNHMDIVGKETLENMLSSYTGTLLFVSHDRYFVQQVADSLLIFEPGTITLYPYSYSNYLEERAEKKEAASGHHSSVRQISPTKKIPKETATKADNPGKIISKAKQKQKRLEERIEIIEKQLKDKKNELSNPEYTADYVKLTEINNAIDLMENELEEIMLEWNEVSESL